jgi:hypothetical protein
MSIINCNYITDAMSYLCESVSARESDGVDVNYFQAPSMLPQYQLMTHSHYFVYFMLSSNLCNGCEWLGEGI